MNLDKLPENLPQPIDDGAADHLVGEGLPRTLLRTTNNETIDLSDSTGLIVLYIYPMTGRPDTPLPDGWNAIAGARGCTPQSCSFRDSYEELRALGAKIFGLSSQSTDFQREAKNRLNLPFELLSDSELALKFQLGLPTFKVKEMELYKRVTLIIVDSSIRKVFYPVFPPSENANKVLLWLRSNTLD